MSKCGQPSRASAPAGTKCWRRRCAKFLSQRTRQHSSRKWANAEIVPSAVAAMCSKVIQPGARRGVARSPQPPVNNFAATKFATGNKDKPGRIAPRRSRSSVAKPARLKLRAPADAAARPKTSERTAPCEGLDTSTTRGQPTMPRKARMKSYSELTHFAGLDWAKDHHDVNIVDR